MTALGVAFERVLLAFVACFAKPTIGDPCDDLVGEGTYGDHPHLPSADDWSRIYGPNFSFPAGELRPASLCAPVGVLPADRGFDTPHTADCECQDCWNWLPSFHAGDVTHD